MLRFSETNKALSDLTARMGSYGSQSDLPFVTLCYAQALDGTIAHSDGSPLRISCPEATRLAHDLRARHDAILVGVGTILSDNPRLTTRLCPGPSPRPVVLDSRLRTPLDARIFDEPPAPILATTTAAQEARSQAFADAGASVLAFPSTEEGRVQLKPLLQGIGHLGIRSIMVEGGSRVIASFLKERLVHAVCVTLALRYAAGKPVLAPVSHGILPRIIPGHIFWAGADLMLFGEPDWGDAP